MIVESKIRRKDDSISPARPMSPAAHARSFSPMKRVVLISLLALGLLLLAVGGWTVQGLRWALGGGRRRARLATA
jgi:hypothetical protein